MKQMKRILWLALAVLGLGITQAFAQMQMPPLPIDPNVRIGKLENGLTYYIRHNEKPENRVEFYIAQKVGSILEEPAQRGLAHFLEHMAFNGTKNFPGDERGLSIVEWCESKGIKFGTNLNAYTSVDETVYNINNVPTTNQAVVDSCLLILHDWSNFINLSDKEIDKERGVIREEWRSRNSGLLRVYTDAQATMYPNSKYADCMPIGSIDVINNFPYDVLRNYYSKWYRPDLQGIFVVGDINVDEMEGKIKTLFADIKKPVNPAERIYYPVTDNQEPIVYIGSDKEVDTPNIQLYFKQDATPDSLKGSMMYMLSRYMLNMVSRMLDARFEEITQKANPPFVGASSYYGEYFLAKTKEAFSLTAVSKADGIEDALKSVLTEVQRMRKYGFTATEYDRARADYLQMLESAYKEREKTQNTSYVREYTDHFLNNEPIPGIEYEYSTMNQIAPNIPVEAINQLAQQGLVADTNQVVFIAIPEDAKEKCPTKEAVLAMMKGLGNIEVEAYVDQVSDEPLLKELPTGGKIVKESTDIYGTTKLELSNGAKVYLKKTDFKEDEILLRGTSQGGNSLYPDKEILQLEYLDQVATVGGLGNFSQTELTKQLAGKKVSVNTSIGNITERVSGSCSPKDFETMMQLVYLSFTSPRMDNEAFESFKSRTKAQLESAKANPLSVFSDSLSQILYNHHPRVIAVQPEMLDRLDYNRIVEIYKDRFADAGDFKFYLVGNMDLEQVKPLIAQYIGGLPATKRIETYKDNHLDIVKGQLNREIKKEQQTPMATVIMVYSGTTQYSLKNNILMNFLNQILTMDFTEEVREKEGGTYGVQCGGNISYRPQTKAILQIMYQTDPEKKDKLNQLIGDIVSKMATQGPTDEQMQKVKEYMLKKYTDNQKENNYWLGNLDEYFDSGIDFTNGFTDLVNRMTAKDVKDFANSLVSQGNKATVVLTVPDKQ